MAKHEPISTTRLVQRNMEQLAAFLLEFPLGISSLGTAVLKWEMAFGLFLVIETAAVGKRKQRNRFFRLVWDAENVLGGVSHSLNGDQTCQLS